MEDTISYNLFLYQKREELAMSKKQAAKEIGLPFLRYVLLEGGYIKPSKRDILNISYYYGIDYSEYVKGIHSYPEVIKAKESKMNGFIYKTCSSKILRIILLCLSFLSLAFSLSGYILGEKNKSDVLSFYSSDFNSFYTAMQEKGDVTYSVASAFKRPTIYKATGDKFVSIITSYDKLNVQDFDCYVNYRDDKAKLNYTVKPMTFDKKGTIDVSYFAFDGSFSYKSFFSYDEEKKAFELGYILSETSNTMTEEETTNITKTFSSHIDEILPSLSSIINQKLGIRLDMFSFLKEFSESSKNYNDRYYAFMLTTIIAGMNFSFYAFLTCMVFIYGKHRKDCRLELVNSVEHPIYIPKQKHEYRSLKPDWHFSPFLPETLFEIAGIVLTFFGSLKIFYYISVLLSAGDGIGSNFQSFSNFLSAIFTIGLFLLYFIDFDLFLNPKKGLRNACFNFFLFLSISFFIGYTLTLISESNNILFEKLTQYPIPNNFGTISMYFLLIIFLFMTPKWVNTKKKLIFYRLLSLLPIGIIFTTTLIYYEYRNWGWELNYFQRYLFSTERPQFSFLCVSYLLLLYFMKLFYQHRYGEENAKRFFLSNRFYFLKNILVTSLILIIAAFELSMKHLDPGNLKGLGQYWQVIFLVPFLPFYHPHVGEKKTNFDWGIKGLYVFFFGFAYILIGIILFGIILSVI